MRSIWKGHIRFSLVTIPIQVYNAVESSTQISFNQIHKADMGRVSYRKVCRTCSAELSPGDIIKGFEYAPDQYVVLDKQELDAIKLNSTRAIDVEAFIDIDEVHPSRFEAVYFIGPNGEVAQQTFALFLAVLKKTGKAGVGKIVLRDREDVVVIKAEQQALVMYKLRYPDEMRDIDKVPDVVNNVKEDDAQVALAELLVASLIKPFDEIDFKDRYKEALMNLVNQKIEGKEMVVIGDDTPEVPVIDIMDALKASIEEAKKRKNAM